MPSPCHAGATANRHRLSVEVEDARCVLVDAENIDAVRELLLEHAQASLAHVTEARVVGATLCVVVVRYQRGAKPDGREQVQSLQPVRRLAHLVHLVHGQRDHAEPARCRAREGDATTVTKL